MLRHSVARIIYTWIEERAEDNPLPASMFYSTQPPDPVNAITLQESEGRPHGRGFKTGKTQESYGLKALARAGGEGPADQARYFIFWLNSQLQGPDFKGSKVTLEGVTYTLHAAHQYGTIVALGLPDKTKQAQYSQNYFITIQGT